MSDSLAPTTDGDTIRIQPSSFSCAPSSLQTTDAVTPEMVRPYPKSPERKKTTRGRQPGKSRILTDTPEKTELENQKNKN